MGLIENAMKKSGGPEEIWILDVFFFQFHILVLFGLGEHSKRGNILHSS